MNRLKGLSGELLDAAPDAMVVVNDEGRILLVNAQVEKMFGHRREDLIGKELGDPDPSAFSKYPSGPQKSVLCRAAGAGDGSGFGIVWPA